MKLEELENKMKNLESPDIRDEGYQDYFKLYLISTKQSAGFGILLLLAPVIFVTGMLFKYQLGIDLGILTAIASWIGDADHIPGLNWLVRFALLGGPLLAVLINLLAITHFQYQKSSRELLVTFRLRWFPILFILFCMGILAVFFVYLIVENAG